MRRLCWPLPLSLEDFDYCNNGRCDAPNEVDYESNYTVASLGARYIFTPHIEAGLAASYEYYSSYERFAKTPTMKCTVRRAIAAL